MMRMRALWPAAGGLALVLVAAGLLANRTRPAPVAALACPALAARAGTADRIELAQSGQVLWLQRRGSLWGLAPQGGYPAQPGRVEALMDALRTLRLQRPATDPAAPASDSSVRVLASSGATLCALVSGPGGAVRRPGDPQAWLPDPPFTLSAAPGDWSQHALPPPDLAALTVVDDGGLGTAALPHALAVVAFTDVRARALLHPVPDRVVHLALADGTADLAVGTQDGQAWLLVSGTSLWARRLAPYAFALPTDSPLAAAS